MHNKCVMEVYKASFDKSGNLVMTARIVNNTTDYITALKDVNIVVKDASGKTVCVGTTEVEAAEKFTTIIAPTQTEQATAGTEVKTPFSLTKSYGFVAQIVTEAPVDMTITVYDSVGNKVQRAEDDDI